MVQSEGLDCGAAAVATALGGDAVGFEIAQHLVELAGGARNLLTSALPAWLKASWNAQIRTSVTYVPRGRQPAMLNHLHPRSLGRKRGAWPTRAGSGGCGQPGGQHVSKIR
jgi:hypothetical protein